MNANIQYHGFLNQILSDGIDKNPSRKQNEGTIELFGKTSPMVFDLSEGVPVISTKKVWVKGIIEELKWFLTGSTNIKPLIEKGVHIWNGNAYDFYKRLTTQKPVGEDVFLQKVMDEDVFSTNSGEIYKCGDLGRMYGYQWRHKKVVTEHGNIVTIDPLLNIIKELRTKPNSRQILLDTYDPYDAKNSALPPCHTLPLFFNTAALTYSERVRYAKALDIECTFTETSLDALGIPKYRLNAEMIQRSGDAFLGVPFNITSSSLMVLWIAQLANMVPGTFSHHVVNAHIYKNHIDAVIEQLSRDASVNSYFAYEFKLDEQGFLPKDININYKTSCPEIKAKMIV